MKENSGQIETAQIAKNDVFVKCARASNSVSGKLFPDEGELRDDVRDDLP